MKLFIWNRATLPDMQSNIQILQTKKVHFTSNQQRHKPLSARRKCHHQELCTLRFSEAKCGHHTSRNLRNSPFHYLLRQSNKDCRSTNPYDLTYHFQYRLIPHQVDIDHEGCTGLTKYHGSCPLREGCPGKYLE